MRRLIKFLQSYFLHSWTLSPPFYINHRKKNPVCYPASYLFRLVINVQEKRTSSLYKIIMHNYIHNSSLWQIPSPCPVVLSIWSGFYSNSLNFNDTVHRKNTKKGQIQQGKGKQFSKQDQLEIIQSFLLSVSYGWSRHDCHEILSVILVCKSISSGSADSVRVIFSVCC